MRNILIYSIITDPRESSILVRVFEHEVKVVLANAGSQRERWCVPWSGLEEIPEGTAEYTLICDG